MQGFLALGLFVGIAGLGVVMVRAVRERRRTIGVLRALGFRADAIRRAFMAESTFIAVEGIVIGAVLAVLTTWLLYRNSAAFRGLEGPYPIAWRDITRDPRRHVRSVDPRDASVRPGGRRRSTRLSRCGSPTEEVRHARSGPHRRSPRGLRRVCSTSSVTAVRAASARPRTAPTTSTGSEPASPAG